MKEGDTFRLEAVRPYEIEEGDIVDTGAAGLKPVERIVESNRRNKHPFVELRFDTDRRGEFSLVYYIDSGDPILRLTKLEEREE